MADKKTNIIDLREVYRLIKQRKKLFLKVLPIVFVVASIYIFSQPRYYTSDARLVPEMGSSMDGSTLGSIASAFGFSFGDTQTADAINPLLYPDLMDDNAFVCSLFNITVQTQDGELKTSYYDYLLNHQKSPWWNSIINFIKKLFPTDDEGGAGNGTTAFNPYSLTKKQTNIVGQIQQNVVVGVDKKTGVISIGVQDQDPLICKTINDSVATRLQDFITDYRTNKARVDMDYYKALADSAKAEYTEAYRRYAAYADANTNVVLQRYQTKMNDMENDMQLKYQTYSALTTQLQAAKGKVQERTPVFTTLKGATVPIRPAGPKRVFFVLGMLILASVVISLYSIRQLIFCE